VQGLSTTFGWDENVVSPIGFAAGTMIDQAGGIVLSPRAGVVDAAFLGVRPEGSGVIATVTFVAIASGDPAIRIASIDARDPANQKLTLTVAVPPAPSVVPTLTSLKLAGANPFRDRIALALGLSQGGPAEVAVYSVNGRRVRTLLSGPQEPGEYRLSWDGRDDDGRDVAAGVYYVHLIAAAKRDTRPVVLVR